MKTRWSLLLYMTASPRLAPYAKETLKRLCAIPRSGSLAIAVQLDGRGARKPVRYRVEAGRAVVAPPSSWTHRPRRALGDFVDWGLSPSPAARSALVLWGEGGGWIYPAGLYDAPGRAPIDVELETALLGTRRAGVDVLGFDACLMGMVEILYGARNVCRTQVASETFVPLGGWPYRPMGELFAQSPPLAPIAWARRAVPLIRDVKGPATLAAFDATRAEPIALAFRALARELRKLPRARRDEVARARADMIHVGNPYFVDVGSMVRALERRVNERSIARAAAAVRRAVDHARLANACATVDDRDMGGLSIFFPAAKTTWLAPYASLAFAKKTRWDAFLTRFLAD
jgi:Clostripain family